MEVYIWSDTWPSRRVSLKSGTMPTTVNCRPKPRSRLPSGSSPGQSAAAAARLRTTTPSVAGGIGVENRPAGDDRNAQGAEVAAADSAVTEAESAALRCGLTLRNDPAAADVAAVERPAVVHHKGGALNVRQLPEVPQG